MQGDIAQLKNAIEHTLLKPDAQKADICTLAQEAIANNFFGVCVNSSFVEIAKKELALSNVKLVCVISFPLGAVDFESKAFETDRAINNGADEVDMVIHLGALKAIDTAWVKKDIAAVVRAAQGHPVKVIIETALLNNEEKTLACILSAEAGIRRQNLAPPPFRHAAGGPGHAVRQAGPAPELALRSPFARARHGVAGPPGSRAPIRSGRSSPRDRIRARPAAGGSLCPFRRRALRRRVHRTSARRPHARRA